MFEKKDEMIRVHAVARSLDLGYRTNAAAVIPFRPGARKYFVERGLKLN